MSKRRSSPILALLPALLVVSLAARAADTQAGKVEFQRVCSQCHDPTDWKGKSEAQLTTLIEDVSSGKAKHPKKLGLTDAQAADIAAWVTSASN